MWSPDYRRLFEFLRIALVMQIVLMTFCAVRAIAQPHSATRFNAETTLVLIAVTVTDPGNRFVLGLHKEDFRLKEDGIDQPISHFSGEDAPLSIGLVFDISGSMDFKLRISRQAALQFLRTM